MSITAVLFAGYYYKRSIDQIHAQQSFDSGMRLFTIARYPQSILAFDRAISLNPSFAEAYLIRGRANAGDSRTDAAISDFTRALALRPNNIQAMLLRGREYLEVKDYRAAVADADRALAADSRFAPAFNLRGMAERALGDPRKALEDFTRAISLSPVTDNYFQRGATYQVMGDHQRAILDFDEMLRIQPDAAPAYFARAESRLALGDERGAEEDRAQGRILDGR